MRRSFRPSMCSMLEERIALSHAASAIVIAPLAVATPLQATYHGHVITVTNSGIDNYSQNTQLSGSARLPRVGLVFLSAEISNNFVSTISDPNQGTATIVTTTNLGTLTLTLSGQHSNLAPSRPTTTHLAFTVTGATGQLGNYLGAKGTAALTLTTTNPNWVLLSRTSYGSFNLRLSLA